MYFYIIIIKLNIFSCITMYNIKNYINNNIKLNSFFIKQTFF